MERRGSHVERSRATREALVGAARALFAERGYAGGSTETVLAATGLTRGALYHHFPDKAALFEAVCEGLHREVAARVLADAEARTDLVDGLIAGCLAFVDFVVRPDVRRILLVDAPSVLGWTRWNDLDRRHGFGLLLGGVREAVRAGVLAGDPEVLALLLNGGVNQAVMWAGQSDDPAAVERIRAGLVQLIETLRVESSDGG